MSRIVIRSASATCHYLTYQAMLKPKFLRHFMLLSAFRVVVSTKAMIAVDAHAQSHMRTLSPEVSHTDRDEERSWDNLLAKVAWKVEELAPSLRLQLKEKLINFFFEHYHHVKSVQTNLFASEQYQQWATAVLGAYEDSAEAYMALFHELKKHFNDYELATFVLDGLASLKTEAVAKEYYELLIKEWVANKKAHNVFRALKLDADKGNVFKNPLLEIYVSSARRLPRKDVLDEKPIFSKLYTMLKLKFGVVRLAEMLGAPNVDLRKGSVGNGVMKMLFWDVSSGETYDSLEHVQSVFVQYAVEDSSALSIWLSYAGYSLTKADYEKLVTGMVNSLWGQRELKVKTLATVIAAAQKSASTRNAASTTLKKLFEEWEIEKKTTSDVLNILGINLAEIKTEDMTEGPLLETWYAFEARRHDLDANLREALLSQLTEEQLASMIHIKTSNRIIKARISRLEKALFRKWKAEFVDEDDAFVRLQLQKAGDKLFTHPALTVWLTYVLNHLSSSSDALIAQVVTKYYRDHESLLDMVRRELKKEGYSSAKTLGTILRRNEISS